MVYEIEEAKKQSEKQLDDEILLATLNAKDISEQSFSRGKNKGEYYGMMKEEILNALQN